MKICFFALRPRPKLSPPLGAQGGHLGSCHEHTILFICKGIYIQKIESLLLLGMEKRILEVTPLGALPLGPPGGHLLHMNKFGSLPPEDDPSQVWLKSANRFWRRR